MTKVCGVDNGVSGSLTIIDSNSGSATYYKMPIKEHLKYTKKKAWMKRIDTKELKNILEKELIGDPFKPEMKVYLERPMVNPRRFNASASALRALEATLIVLEELQIPYEFIDSKEWQRIMLPKGLKGTAELKKASLQVAKRLFPHLSPKNDGDSILIAEHYRKKKINYE